MLSQQFTLIQKYNHQIRNTTRYVSYKDIKELMIDLKNVYKANTKDITLFELDNFEERLK